MSAKANGLYSNWKMYFLDGTGWFVGLDPYSQAALGLKFCDGWGIVDEAEEFRGAALVAPLPILFWEKR